MLMQYTDFSDVVKIENFDIFLTFAQNIDCGYTLEPPKFFYIKVGNKGVYTAQRCFPDVDILT